MRLHPVPALRLSSLAMLGALCAITAGPTAARATCDPFALFGPAYVNFTGPNPAFLVSRDFNQDGIADLAVTNTDFQNGGVNNSVAILIGTGSFGYAAPVLYPVQLNPHMLAASDFNDDGITDLVVCNKWSSTLTVLLGQGSGGVGNGTFAADSHYVTGGYPFQIVVEDFDRDSIEDVAVTINSSPGYIALLRGGGGNGVGNGTFLPPVFLPLLHPSTGLERGDFNGDGITDLIATENAGGLIAVYRGTGSTTFGTGMFLPAFHLPAGPLPFDLGVGDFNEDGRLDLAVAEQTAGGGTRIMFGNGDGTFGGGTSLATGNTVVISPDDVNQDGITDLAIGTITGFNTGYWQIFLGGGGGGVGDGTFTAGDSDGTHGDPYQILPGDFDGDGRRDLVVSYYLNTFIAVFPGLCSADSLPPPPPPDPAPVLTDVRDVPNDEGGRVFLTWTASSLDTIGGPVHAYRVWRRIPPALTGAMLAATRSRTDLLARPAAGTASALIEYWEALATLPAQRLLGYGYTAATTQDSLPGSNPYTAFFVSALTADIDVFYSSNVDSGYSVDNLPPPEPAPFIAEYSGAAVHLRWTASPAPDFAEFRLHRGRTAGFVPGPANLIMAGGDTSHVDITSSGIEYYKLTAVDIHGNAGPYALASPPAPVGIGPGNGAARLALRPPTPNPGHGRWLVVEFTLADASPARLELVDVAGRLVTAREVGALGGGAHRVELAGPSPLRAGLYFVRLTQGGVTVRERAAVVR